MKIIIKNGEVKCFRDSGDLREQATNFEALINLVVRQGLAYGKLAEKALDPTANASEPRRGTK